MRIPKLWMKWMVVSTDFQLETELVRAEHDLYLMI
jgi:hypothetical protein